VEGCEIIIDELTRVRFHEALTHEALTPRA
jgi:hypothetical protein